MNKAYTRIDWENYPSINTPINESNLNKMDAALDELDNRVISLDTSKATKTEVATLVADVSFVESTGIITVTKKNGSVITIDTKMEKIAVNFDYNSDTQQIILTLIDGTKQYIDLSALITQYEFLNSDTITFAVQADGSIKAEVLDGSITDNKIEGGYLAQIKVETSKSESYMNSASQSATSANNSANLSKSYAVGGTGTRENEDTDNAMYYYEKAKQTDIGQISLKVDEINSNLDGLEFGEVAGGENLFVAKHDGYYSSDGKINKSADATILYKCSDIIKFNGSKIYISTDKAYASLLDGKGAWVGIVCFDSNKNFINESYLSGYMGSALKYNFTLPSGVCYVGMSSMKGVNVCFSEKEIDYTPYIPSVKMLAEEISKQNESLSVIGKCKNLLNTILQTTTQNGITCTNNGDGTYTLNGTVATGNYAQFTLLSNKISAGTYKLVGNPDYSLGCSLYFSGHGDKEIDYGNGGIVNFASDITTTDLYLYIPSGVTLTNVVFKPMLTTNLNATYDDFVPYTGDGATLTHDVAEIKNDLVNKEFPVGSVVMIFAESATPVFAYGTWNKMNTEPYSFDTSSGGASSRIAVYFYRRIS